MYLNLAHCTCTSPVEFGFCIESIGFDPIQNARLGRRSGTTSRMPYRTTLQVHFLAIAERIATFGAPGARRMEVMIVTSLQHFAADVPITVGTLNTERFLEILLAVRHTIFAHVLTIERNSTSVTPERKKEGLISPCSLHNYSILLLEAPNVPLPIQCDQRLTFLQLLMASGALVRINVFAILLLPDRFMVVLKCGCLRRTGGDFFDRLLLLFLFDLSLWGRCRGIRQLLGSRHRSFHTILAEHFFAGVCDLMENRLFYEKHVKHGPNSSQVVSIVILVGLITIPWDLTAGNGSTKRV